MAGTTSQIDYLLFWESSVCIRELPTNTTRHAGKDNTLTLPSQHVAFEPNRELVSQKVYDDDEDGDGGEEEEMDEEMDEDDDEDDNEDDNL